MNLTDIFKESEIEAFELFCKSIEVAKAKTISISVKRLNEEIEAEDFWMDNVSKRIKFKTEFKRMKTILKKESEQIICNWFNEFML